MKLFPIIASAQAARLFSKMGNAFGFAVILASLPMSSALADEWWVGAYGGYNTSFNSDVTVKRGGTAMTYSDVSWDGASFEMPPYWGIRGSYWFDAQYSNFGVMLDYSHAKVKADLSGTALGADFSHFQFTDGLNLLALNGLYRLPLSETFTPYAGLGLGISVPDVETTARSGGAFDGMPRTYEYKLAGPILQVQIGIDAKITESISAFAEYKFDYSWNRPDLNGGGTLDVDVGTNQFILGVTYKFNCYTIPASLK
jgi:lipid A oxidase